MKQRNACLLAGLIALSMLGGCASFVGFVKGDQPIREQPGKRTWGTALDDEIIETKTLVNIRKAAPAFEGANVSVTSFNGIVLLTGQVPTEELRMQAGGVAQKVRGVRRVHNELQVAGVTSGIIRSNDAWLTAKVKTAFVTYKNVDGSRIKVVTENGVVYLMGLVTNGEAQAAVNVARNVSGVQRIVKIFEYIG